MEKVLLLDLGGTNIRYAIAEKGRKTIGRISKKNIETKDLDKLLEKLLTKGSEKILNLVMSVAGPKVQETIEMTNRSLKIDSNELKKKYNLKECHLLNDWESIAYGHAFLNSQDISNVINKDASPYNKNCLYFGPGTGLGVSILVDERIVISSEYGNTNIGAKELIGEDLFSTNSFKSIEDTISGRTISKIYEIETKKNLSTEEIFLKAKKDDLIAIEIIQDFIARLAIILSDLTLSFLPGKGIFLAGNLIRSLRGFIDIKFFEEKFLSTKDGAHLELLRNTPVNIITKEHSSLYGNLNYFNLSQKD